MDGAVLNTSRLRRRRDASELPPGSRSRWRGTLLTVARVAFLGAALGLLVWRLAGDADGALRAVGRIGLPAVLAALLAAAAGMGASGMAWRSLLRGVGAPLTVRGSVRVFFIGQIGKYIPGTVWAYVAQAKLGREHGVPASRTTAASVLFVVAHAATGAAVAGLVLPFASESVYHRFGWVSWLAPLLLCCLHPRLVLPVLRGVHRILGRGTPPQQVSGLAVLGALGWLSLTWVGYGLSMLVLLGPVLHEGSRALLAPLALGGFALAWTVGFLAAGVLVVTPAGLGVREVALLALLAPVVPGGGAAAAVVLLSRVVHTVSDGLWALAGLALRAPLDPAPDPSGGVAGQPGAPGDPQPVSR